MKRERTTLMKIERIALMKIERIALMKIERIALLKIERIALLKIGRIALLLALPLLCSGLALAQSGETETLKLGTRTFTITEKTPDGTPILHFWQAKMPTSDQTKAVGFPVLKEAQHFDVWKPAGLEEGVYNHYACLILHNGLFYASWGNHSFGENGPGQRVLYATSLDGKTWEAPQELFPAPGPVLPRGERGVYLCPDRFVEVEGKLYAVAYVFGSIGTNLYPIAREVDGSRLGEPFLLKEIPSNVTLPQFMPASTYNPVLAQKIQKWYKDQDAISWWAYSEKIGIPNRGINDAALIESYSFRSKDGLVAFLRDYSTHAKVNDRKSSNRVYACFEDGNGGWSAVYPTDIPDSHSRGQAIKLSDGSVLLIGNQIAHQFDKGLYLKRDPLTVAFSPDGTYFTNVFALRSAGEAGISHRFSDIPGSKPAGYGYLSSITHNDTLYVCYTVNKEDIAISIVPLSLIKNYTKISVGYEYHTINVDPVNWHLTHVSHNYRVSSDYLPPSIDTVKGSKHLLDSRVVPHYNKMYDAALADGVTLVALIGFRTQEWQENYFNNKVNRHRVEDGMTELQAIMRTTRGSAYPGASEHNLGLCMDFTPALMRFEESDQFAWLMENAANFGFILRFPSDKRTTTGINYEPWHWRYVGVEAAQQIKAQGICFEEYLGRRYLSPEDAQKLKNQGISVENYLREQGRNP